MPLRGYALFLLPRSSSRALPSWRRWITFFPVQLQDVRWKRFAEPIFRANLRQFLFQLLLTIINVMWPPYPPEVELSLSTILQPQVPSYTTTGRLALELSFLFMGASKFLTEFGELLDKRGSYLGGQSGATFIENFCGLFHVAFSSSDKPKTRG
eukprot:SAG31_NODE_1863_length_7037_cov_2.325742_6_plen_154_part_00